jgi:hypothetical protein|tara:strand:+ start:1291 stop:1452 length:162 start_codon:yes stop_codon:yes gene_type:complete
MTINGYKIEGTKKEYINILVNNNNANKKELEKMSFYDVVVEYCFFYNPLVLAN